MAKEYEVIGSEFEADAHKAIIISERKEIIEKQTITLSRIKERIINRQKQIDILIAANNEDQALLDDVIDNTGLDINKVPNSEPVVEEIEKV